MSKIYVLMLFGGESSEHDVSVNSARNVYEAIDTNRFSVDLCYIDRVGKWWLLDAWKDDPATHLGEELSPLLGKGQFQASSGAIIAPDVIFPVLHGKNGEDGTVQGLAELVHVPIVGCGIAASALCMDKQHAKIIVSSYGVATADWVMVTPDAIAAGLDEIKHRIPDGSWFVKPSRSGSSVGVSKVTEFSELESAIRQAHEHDSKVLIERSVEGRELEVAVLGTPPNHRTSNVGEIIPGAEFYDYDDKYSSTSQSQVVLSADLPENTRTTILDMTKTIYEVLDCSGLARVDFLLERATGTLYFNEVNTLPGFTNISMYPKLWQEAGLTYSELLTTLIEDALERRK